MILFEDMKQFDWILLLVLKTSSRLELVCITSQNSNIAIVIIHNTKIRRTFNFLQFSLLASSNVSFSFFIAFTAINFWVMETSHLSCYSHHSVVVLTMNYTML